MVREMPARRWRTLPEAALIPHLLTTAHERADRLIETRTADTARSFVPETEDLDVLRGASSSCRGCRLHEAATRVVFGEGRAMPRLSW
jgi:uracil-DNA glycosylase